MDVREMDPGPSPAQRLRSQFSASIRECEALLSQLEEEEATFESEVARAEAAWERVVPIEAGNKMIRLDVGGSKFNTTRACLSSQPGFFRVLCEGYVPVELDSEGCIFIDRNGSVFRFGRGERKREGRLTDCLQIHSQLARPAAVLCNRSFVLAAGGFDCGGGIL